MDDRLKQEAEAFDLQIRERIEGGHVPDIRNAAPCDYFYNNVWRRPEYVDLSLGDIFKTLHHCLKRYGVDSGKLLEVGCGPGFMSLEFAREGFAVTGLDLSPACIELARETAAGDAGLGRPPQYLCSDFLTAPLAAASFDVVLFQASLHHFPDQDAVAARVHELLKLGGLVLFHEPCRDLTTPYHGLITHLITTLLSAGGGYYQPRDIPANPQELDGEIQALTNRLKYETEDGEKAQSVNDNEAGFLQMHAAFSNVFTELETTPRSAFFADIVGGLRFDEALNRKLAHYLKDIEACLMTAGLPATEMLFVGRKSN